LTEKPDVPFTVTINLGDIGGPSAGLMFALAVVDKLTPGALAGNTFVAGTGEITTAGQVGAIGGIPLKMIRAREAGPRCSSCRRTTVPRRCSVPRQGYAWCG